MVKLARRGGVLIAAIAAIVPATAVFAAPTSAASNANKVYNSLSPPQGNLPSIGFEADSASSLGNEITLTRAGTLASVQVTMDSWGCQSGSWTDDTCATTPGATFSMPITLTLYDAPSSDPSTQADTPGSGLPGAQITTVTDTFSVPYRPSANNTKCVGAELGDWFDKTNRECFPGLMTNISFNIGSLKVAVPETIVYEISYNTSDYGAAPYGDGTACHSTTEGCPYDSLNVGLSLDPDNIQRGSDTNPGTLWWNTLYAPYYCDGGAAGTGTFRFDSPSTSPCWGADSPYTTAPWYVPAVQFVGAPNVHISVTTSCLGGGAVKESGAYADGATQWIIEPGDYDFPIISNPDTVEGLAPGPYTYEFRDADNNDLSGGSFTIPTCV